MCFIINTHVIYSYNTIGCYPRIISYRLQVIFWGGENVFECSSGGSLRKKSIEYEQPQRSHFVLGFKNPVKVELLSFFSGCCMLGRINFLNQGWIWSGCCTVGLLLGCCSREHASCRSWEVAHQTNLTLPCSFNFIWLRGGVNCQIIPILHAKLF